MSLKMNTRSRIIVALVFSGLLLAGAPTAVAQGQDQSQDHETEIETETEEPPASPSLERYRSALETGDEEQILRALGQIRAAKDPAATPLVNALLERGGTVTVTMAAIQTID